MEPDSIHSRHLPGDIVLPPPELGPSPVRQVTPTEWGWEDGYETDQTYA